ncbi:39S ribosomal protein L50 [Paragonimus westermani]|uniref:Large ribosomal subunit protein mL50 n=1 Tax=Paragonimus westermani TaxID=34504 RepID=A0A8T0D8R9_9TREM|nr:39S ribosomal protein L50 [Paragonimus westermani]
MNSRRLVHLLPRVPQSCSLSTNKSTSVPPRFQSRLQSLTDASRDNLIAKLPPYTPPANVSSQIQSFAVRLLNASPSNPSAYRFQSNAEKFKLFTACAREFQHPVLNSYIHELTDVSALIQYYQTPVASPDALSRLCEQADQLPSNLSIATKPIRFNPNDTTFFKRTAYPGRSTIVSGLGTAKKYKGFRAPPTRRIRVEYQDRV